MVHVCSALVFGLLACAVQPPATGTAEPLGSCAAAAAPPSLEEQLECSQAGLAAAVKDGDPGAAGECEQLAARLLRLQEEAAVFRAATAGRRKSPSPRAWASALLPSYRDASALTLAWLDKLSLDSTELVQVGIAGKKKLAELLDVYAIYFRNSKMVEGGRDTVLRRVRQATEGTAGNHGPAYHNLLAVNDTVFKQNSMSCEALCPTIPLTAKWESG